MNTYLIQNENTLNKKLDFEGRKIRGYAIISKGDVPEHISHGVYRLPSQSSDAKYIIAHHNPDYWSCSCKDFETRKIECKHIAACKFWLTLKKRIDKKEEIIIPEVKEAIKCLCGSNKIVKFGKVRTSKKQRFICQTCRKTFVADDKFKKFKGNPKVITAVMDLYFKGVSLRKIVDHVKQFYEIEITHVTVYSWIKRFTKIMANYTDQFKPNVSGVWHTDEQMLRLKKKDKWAYCWNVIDAETRFLIAENITEGRDIPEARQVFAKTKSVASKPDVVITDGLWSYEKAIRREFGTGFTPTEHIRLAGIAKKINNNKVERYHNTVRENVKTRRGHQNVKTVQEWSDSHRLYYNYLRPHMKFNGLTPAEVAGVKLNLQGNRWEDLLRKSLEN